MELIIPVFLFLFILILIITVVKAIGPFNRPSPQETHGPIYSSYQYQPRPYIMTSAEITFFQRLQSIAGDRYFIFPQVHLSALLDHKIKGQDWRGAFRHINGKSVDYVLTTKDTLKPVYAIELDDYTHNYEDRAYRDMEVERIFKAANIPLVRFRDPYKLSDEDIATKLAHTKRLTESSTNNS